MMNLHFVELGSPDKPVVILIHGLFGANSNLRSIAKALIDDYRVFIVDNRNHGASPWHNDMNYPIMASDINEFCQQQNLQQVTLIGHSMGGKIAMRSALNFPERINALVIADIAPKKYSHQNEHLQYIHAMKTMDLSQIKNRQDALNAFIEKTGAVLSTAQFICQNLIANNENDSSNKFKWRINLASLENNMDALLDFPIRENETPYKNPSLFIYGSLSPYVKETDKTLINQYYQQTQFVEIKEANHWLHAEKPNEFNAHVLEFLNANI